MSSAILPAASRATATLLVELRFGRVGPLRDGLRQHLPLLLLPDSARALLRMLRLAQPRVGLVDDLLARRLGSSPVTRRGRYSGRW